MSRSIALRGWTFSGRVVAAFAAIYLLWGGTYLAIALGLHSIPPLLLMGVRAVAAGAILLVISAASTSAWPSRTEWLHAAVGGVLLFAGCHGALGYAQQSVPSGLAAVMLATIPFWMVLLGVVFPVNDGPRAAQLLALIPGFAGVALITWPGAQQELKVGLLLLLLASALSWAAGSIYAQRYSAGTAPTRLAGAQMLCGGAVLTALGVALGELNAFTPAKVDLAAVLSFAYLALAGGAIAFTSYVWLLERMPAPIVATYTFVNPVIAVLLGWAVLGEVLTGRMLAGIALVVASLMVLVRLSSRTHGADARAASRV